MTRFIAYVCPLCGAWTHDPKVTNCVGGTNGRDPEGTAHEMAEREAIEMIPRAVADNLAYEAKVHLEHGHDDRYLYRALAEYKAVVHDK